MSDMDFDGLKERINVYTEEKTGKKVINAIVLTKDPSEYNCLVTIEIDADTSINQLNTAIEVFFQNIEYTEEWDSLEKLPNFKLVRT